MLIRLDIDSDGLVKKPNKVLNICEITHGELYEIDHIKQDENEYYLLYLKEDGIVNIWTGVSNNSVNIVDTSIYDIYGAERSDNQFHVALKTFIREKNLKELDRLIKI